MSPIPWSRVRTGILATGIALLAAEIAARFAGPGLKTPPYTYVAAGHEEYFGTSRITIPYDTHRPYYWLPRPHTPLTNAQGFRGRDWSPAKRPGVTRVACLGCSCTMGGQEPYPQRLERLLAEAGFADRYEVLNAGVGSSSTHQILQILERHVLAFAPDILVIYSGWNDLAVHDGRPDAAHRLPAPWQVRLQRLLEPSHLIKLLAHAAGRSARQRPVQRVPVKDYEKNLLRIAAMGKEHGARVVLCTFVDGLDARVIDARARRRPGPHDWQNDLYRVYLPYSSEPREQWRFAVQQYHDAVRAAASNNTDFVDLHAVLAPELTRGLPILKDGIHFTEYGHQRVAETLAASLLGGAEAERVAAYLAGASHAATNASVMAVQAQYAAAAHYLERAGSDPHGLRAVIARERPFHDRYDEARRELSNGGDPAHAAMLIEECLRERPDNHDVRIDLAELSAQLGQPARAIELALGSPRSYDPAQGHRALWVGARAARDLGQRDLAVRLLRELVQRYPEDPLALGALREVMPR